MMLLLCSILSVCQVMLVFSQENSDPEATTPQTMGTPMNSDVFADPLPCENSSDCRRHGDHAICVEASIMHHNGTQVTVMSCRCNADQDYHKHGDRCYYHADLDQVCDEYSVYCDTVNATCQPSNTHTDEHRCQCTHGYHPTRYQGMSYCGELLVFDTGDRCQECQGNDGQCLDVTHDGVMDKCQCPHYRSGASCEVNHLDVACDYHKNEMVICYTAHPAYTTSTSPDDISIYATEYKNSPVCTGSYISDDTEEGALCSTGAYELVLDISSRSTLDVSQCGVTYQLIGNGYMRHTGHVTVSDKTDIESQKAFMTGCEHATKVVVNDGKAVESLPGNHRGIYFEAHVNIRFKHASGVEIPDGSSIRLGDQVIVEANLENSNTYSSLLVQHCLASNSPTEPDPLADTTMMVRQSCPADGQSYINIVNNFRHTSAGPHQMATGAFRSFQLGSKRVLYMHCIIKVCLIGSEQDCVQPSCADDSGSTSRRRRDTSDTVSNEETLFSARLEFQDEENYYYTGGKDVVVMETKSFAIMIFLLIAIIILLALVSARLFYSKLANTKAMPSVPNIPIRFAMQRNTKPQRF